MVWLLCSGSEGMCYGAEGGGGGTDVCLGYPILGLFSYIRVYGVNVYLTSFVV